MAFDGIITRSIVKELREALLLGKVDRIHQPIKDQLIFTVHTKAGNLKLFASAGSSDPRIHLIQDSPSNPPSPYPFCMLLRKHLLGGRIIDIRQKGFDRIIEIDFEAMNELGFTLSKRLVVEIMGKHSNIILVDIESGKVIDAIKHVSFDTSKVRQILPGIQYTSPPPQEKKGFDEITETEFDLIPNDSRSYLNAIGGISPQVADSLAESDNPWQALTEIRNLVQSQSPESSAHVYIGDSKVPVDFHIVNLRQYENLCQKESFESLSPAINFFFENRDSTSRLKQRSHALERNLSALLEKYKLKLQRLFEDLAEAKNSDNYRLYGELLTANLHLVKPGTPVAKVTSYYDGSQVEIPLDPSRTPAKNAQDYFKKYGKAKTAIKEKTIQIEETKKDIEYLESVQTSLSNITKGEEVDIIQRELIETGYLRKKKSKEKPQKFKSNPYKYTSPSGYEILVGRNNKENDELTLKIAEKTDIWLHTKDIPGSHVIIRTKGNDPEPEDIYFAASIAAWHSKGRDSGQVPVDYVRVRHVKKPSGAKPGMVIFTDNHTVYVEPHKP